MCVRMDLKGLGSWWENIQLDQAKFTDMSPI